MVEAYLSGLEDLHAGGGDLSSIASVASFFVSRVDTKVDKLLAGVEGENAEQAKTLEGKIAVANSKVAYAHWEAALQRWSVRPGWRRRARKTSGASGLHCSTKNPNYPDTLYVADLIGPETVEHHAQRDDRGLRGPRGRPAHRGRGCGAEAEARIQALAGLGIDMTQVTYELEREGVHSFDDSFDELLATVAKQVAAVAG